MRLELRCPSSWRVSEVPGSRELFVPDGHGGELRVVMTEVGPSPDDPIGWIRARLGAAVVSSAEEQVLPSGWPAILVEASDGVDRSLILMWRIIDHAAVAQARGPAILVAACRDELLAILGAATLDWGEPPLLTLAQIWEGFDVGRGW